MKNRILSLILVSILTLSLTLPVHAADGEALYGRMEEIFTRIREDGLEADPDLSNDQLLQKALIRLFEEDPASFDKLMDAALSDLDSHSMYIPAGTYDIAFADSAAYVGIGVTMSLEEDRVRITAVEPGGPADQAGMLVGDIITHVDGTAIPAGDLAAVSNLVRGPEKTHVTLTVRRGASVLDLTMTRAQVSAANLTGTVLEKGIYYMDFDRFAGTETYQQFHLCLYELKLAKCETLILDLRGNPGGDLSMAMYMINRLIPDEDVDYFMVTAREDIPTPPTVYRSSGIGPELKGIYILVDENSASASEVMASALRDHGYALLVGRQTYGKARAQQHIVYEDGGAAVLTTLKLVPPSLIDYEGVGLTPDYAVENYTARHPAARTPRLHFKRLELGKRGTQTDALRQALITLGYFDENSREVNFGKETLAAVNAFRKDYGLKTLGYLDVTTIDAINAALDSLSAMTVTVDAQLDKALALAREAMKK